MFPNLTNWDVMTDRIIDEMLKQLASTDCFASCGNPLPENERFAVRNPNNRAEILVGHRDEIETVWLFSGEPRDIAANVEKILREELKRRGEVKAALRQISEEFEDRNRRIVAGVQHKPVEQVNKRDMDDFFRDPVKLNADRTEYRKKRLTEMRTKGELPKDFIVQPLVTSEMGERRKKDPKEGKRNTSAAKDALAAAPATDATPIGDKPQQGDIIMCK
jgi:hypothetical protein